MGVGDELMATAQARAAGRRVHVLDKNGNPRWSDLWTGNPNIARPNEKADGVVVNGPGCRPYIDYERMQSDFAAVFPGQPWSSKVRDVRLPWRFNDWSCDAMGPGDLYLSDQETALGRPVVIVEPNIKVNAMPGKQWPWARYEAVVAARPDLPWAQFDYGQSLLPGVAAIRSRSFREACGVLSGALAYVGPEGGLHHAAAALGVPAVVIFGGAISPRTTGYGGHVNLWRDVPGAEGARVPVPAAVEAMEAIPVDEVLQALEALNVAT